MKPAKASAVCLLLGLMSMMVIGTVHADDNPPARIGRISYLKGKVSFLPAGQQRSEATS